MKRRTKAGGNTVKTQRRKALGQRNAPKVPRRSHRATGRETNVEELTRELAEAREREAATSEVLKAISSSPGELTPVFEAMLANATRLCEAKFGNLFLYDGDAFRTAALYGAPPAWAEARQRDPLIRPGPDTGLGRVAKTKQVVHFDDIRATPSYRAGDPVRVALADLAGARTYLCVPMLKEDELIGAITIYRQEVKPFTDKQIDLVKNFAAQAVIAIENTRLLGELRESLQQQTATADVLKAISRETFDLPAVLDTLIASACRLCEAEIGTIRHEDGPDYGLAATYGCQPEWRKHFAGYSTKPDRSSVFGQTILKRGTVHIPDVLEDPDYARPEAQKLTNLRAALGVPLLRDGQVFGVVSLFRTTPRPFTQKQIKLAETFADQAVIAIENVRLFEAEQQRTRELRESLDRHTATADILKVIAASPTDVQPVFDAIVQSATGLLSSQATVVTRVVGDEIHLAALTAGSEHGVKEVRGSFPSPLSSSGIHSRVARSCTPAFRTDIENDPQVSAEVRRLARARGYRSILVVPMLRDGAAIGTIGVTRREPGAFTETQIDLLRTFADQAVIAIENVRLFDDVQNRTEELTESLEQQTATSEVLKIISSSPGELEPVFTAMLESATRICAAKLGSLFLHEGDTFRAVAVYGDSEYADWSRRDPIVDMGEREHKGTPLDRLRRAKSVLHIRDLREDESFVGGNPRIRALVETAGARTHLVVPMLKDDALIGAIVIYRQVVQPFGEKQIELVQNFAAQAVIAIENARLLNELRQRTDDLTESLEQQTTTAEILGVISKSLDDTQPVFDAIVRSGVRLFSGAAVSIALVEDGMVKAAAVSERDPVRAELWRKRFPFPLTREYMHSAAILDRAILDVPDVEQAPVELAAGKSNFLASGYRAATFVPLIRGEAAIGALSVVRIAPGPLSDKQLSTLKTYASQALIAIENARLLSELRQRTDDLTESLEQQTATSEVLEVISSSPGDLTPVFETMLANATRICGAGFGTLYLYNGATFEAAAFHNAPAAFIEARKRGPIDPSTNSTLGRAARTKQVAQVLDSIKSEAYLQGDPVAVAGTELGNYRTIVSVPMLKDDRLVGVISIYRQEVREFTEKQIELVSNFAAQAVIAIENARLLNELRQRTDDLTESLEYQTATSEILTVISRSPTDTQPVFDIIGERAEKLCDADVSVVSRVDGELIQLASIHGVSEEGMAALRSLYPLPLEGETITARTARGAAVVHVADVLADPTYDTKVAARAAGYRACLGVPMIRDGQVIGVVFVGRKEPRPYTDNQVQLLKTFADQAVIAIGNVRLFEEVKARTEDLQESLQQQTATADVLKVISRSAFDLQTVLDTLTESATRVCGANKGVIFQRDGDVYRLGANYGFSGEAEQYAREHPIRPGRGSVIGRVALEGKVNHIPDVLADPEYKASGYQKTFGFRTNLGVPLLREGETIGVFALTRDEVDPFTDKQIALATTFADQAVIAIENVRLFDEVQARTEDLSESLAQQTATADVLKVISRSTFDLQTVLDTLVESAARLCDTDMVAIIRLKGSTYQHAASYGYPPDAHEYMLTVQLEPNRDSVAGRVALEGKAVQVADALNEPGYKMIAPMRMMGGRTVLGVPLLRQGAPIGVLLMIRRAVRTFTDKQIELVTTFADQAVIAIENVRLFDELQAQKREVTEALEHQTATSEVLGVISRSPTNAQPVFDAIAESAARLCDAVFTVVWIYDGELLHYAANHNFTPEVLDKIMKTYPRRPDRSLAAGRAVLDGKIAYVSDMLADPAYAHELARAGNWRASVAVPMLREGKPIGAISVGKADVSPFTDRQIQLLSIFADQAVIAIGNVRLFDEVQARTDDLAESLAQQTATADVLKVISRSTFDLPTVLNTLVESAARLCGADKAQILRPDKDEHHFYAAANYGHTVEYNEYIKTLKFLPGREGVVGRALVERKPVHIADVIVDPDYGYPDLQRLGGFRTHLGIPLLREGNPIGILVVSRLIVSPFDQKQIELLTTFADQAVIAIENARLFEEVKARTEDLQESLAQQTATADVLKIISRSAFDLKTVLDTLLRSAARLCEADQGTITQRMGEKFYRSVAFGYPQEFMDYVKDKPVEINRDTGTGRALLDSKVTHIPDVQADPDYRWPDAQRLGGYRSMLGVPMLRDGEPIGVLTLTRKDPLPFTDKQIDLVATFADQAAIAIENVRLFDEIQEKSRQLEEASKHKSQFLANMSHELRTPLNAILGYTELIADGVYGDTPEKVQTTLKRIITNGKHLLGLINDVLDLSKIEAGQLALSLADYSMRDVVHNVFGAVEPLASEKELTFKADVAPDLPPGYGDERRLTQVLLNLVGNAIKFTDQGSVVIRAGLKDGMFTVTVVDTGPGISERDQKKLFQEFQQADSSTTKKKGGTGLGLAISKRIIEMHEGHVSLESRVGVGSTFGFAVPVNAGQQKRAAT
jgi:two-component system, NtrC family, sensor kinase